MVEHKIASLSGDGKRDPRKGGRQQRRQKRTKMVKICHIYVLVPQYEGNYCKHDTVL